MKSSVKFGELGMQSVRREGAHVCVYTKLAKQIKMGPEAWLPHQVSMREEYTSPISPVHSSGSGSQLHRRKIPSQNAPTAQLSWGWVER